MKDDFYKLYIFLQKKLIKDRSKNHGAKKFNWVDKQALSQ